MATIIEKNWVKTLSLIGLSAVCFLVISFGFSFQCFTIFEEGLSIAHDVSQNTTIALTWLLVISLVVLAWFKPKYGGILFTTYSLFITLFVNFKFSHFFYPITLIPSLMVLGFGLSLQASRILQDSTVK